MDALGFTLLDMYHFLLVAFRTGALFMVVPVFSHDSIPRILRVAVIMIVSFMIYPFTAFSLTQPPATLVHLLMVVFREIAIGYLMGFTVSALFAAVQFAGHVIGLQMGLAVATVIDPMGAGQISIFGEFYYLISLLVFLGINAHHYVIEALVHSFSMVPVGMLTFSSSLAEFLITLTGMIFIVAVKLAAPVIITLFITNAVLGIVARTVPQMNVFIVGFPLSIGIGFALVLISLPIFRIVLVRAIGEMHVSCILSCVF